MKKLMNGIACLVLLGGISAAAVRAQSAPAPAKPAEPGGFQKDALNSLDDAEKKLVALAGATPQEKFSFKPGEGVRSTGEVFNHVSIGNYFYAKSLGAVYPEGLDPRTLDKVTDKDKIIETLKKSYELLRSAITASTDLDKPVKMFGREMTTRAAILLFVTHNHEHLGQSIAYARMNGIVPPWTAEREEQQKKAAQPAKKP